MDWIKDKRYCVPVVINLDGSSLGNCRGYTTYRIKSIKIANIKTLEIYELSIEDFEKSNLSYKLARKTQIMCKNGHFYLRMDSGYSTDYARVNEINNIYAIEIDNTTILNKRITLAAIYSNIVLLKIKYVSSSRKMIIEHCNISNTIDIEYKAIELKRQLSKDLEVLTSVLTLMPLPVIKLNEYSESTSSRINVHGIDLMDLKAISENLIIHNDCNELVIYSTGEAKLLKTVIISPNVSKITWKAKHSSFESIILTKKVKVTALKTFLISFIKNTVYTHGVAFNFESVLNKCKTVNDILNSSIDGDRSIEKRFNIKLLE